MTEEHKHPAWVETCLEYLDGVEPGLLAFDADFTIWSNDIAMCAWNHSLLHHTFKKEANKALSEELIAIGSAPRYEPHADAKQLMELFLMGAASDEVMVCFMTTCYAGWTHEELQELGAQMVEQTLKNKIYFGLREFIDELKSRGHELVVVSASAEDLVKGAINKLGLPFDAVYGVQTQSQDGKVGTRTASPLCFHERKVERLKLEKPEAKILAAFSDSHSDWALLEAASHLRVAINPSERLRAAVEGLERPWLLVNPERTVDNLPCTRYSDEAFEI